MRRRFLRASLPAVSIFLALAGTDCTKHSDGTNTAVDAAPAASSTIALNDAAPLAASAAPVASEINPALPIGNRLGLESQTRPKIHPTAEEVFAAFQKVNPTMKQPTQHLASTYSAKYCASEKSQDEGVLLGVCEFTNEAEATAGRDQNEKMFKEMPNRTVYRNKSTTLAIVERVKSPENDALTKKLVAAFQAL